MIAFWRKKVHYKFIKSSIWTSVLEIWSWTFDGVKDISWQSCGELAILDLNENWYLQNKCSAKNQRTSKIKRRSLLQIESVSWHHSQFHNWVSFVEKPLFDGVNDLRRWREIGDWGKKDCKIDRKDHLEKIATEKRRLLQIWVHWRMP